MLAAFSISYKTIQASWESWNLNKSTIGNDHNHVIEILIAIRMLQAPIWSLNDEIQCPIDFDPIWKCLAFQSNSTETLTASTGHRIHLVFQSCIEVTTVGVEQILPNPIIICSVFKWWNRGCHFHRRGALQLHLFGKGNVRK